MCAKKSVKILTVQSAARNVLLRRMRRFVAGSVRNFFTANFTRSCDVRPLVATWHITHRCNLRCSFCEECGIERNAKWEKEGELSTGDAKQLLAMLAKPFAFLYIILHLSIYFTLDVELDWSRLVEDVADRLYITLGMIGFLLLIPLAITSTKGWIRRLGNRRWNALHRLVYVSAVLGIAHFWIAVKRDIREPLIYALIFAALFAYRLRSRPGRGPASARRPSGQPVAD